MIIGIDGNEANVEKRVGVNQMALEILWGLYKLQDKKKPKHKYTIYLKSSPSDKMPPENDSWIYKILPVGKFWILTKLVPELFRNPKPEIFFTPSHYTPPIAPMPRVCMITDLGYLKFSEQFKKRDYWQLKIWTAISIKISKYIIAISEATNKDIVRHYPFARNKTQVVYLAGDNEIISKKVSQKFAQKTLKKYRITKKYLLFLSTLKPNKNVERLIEAYNMLKNNKDYQLVIVGKKGWLYENIFNKVKKLGLSKQVVFTGFVSPEEKIALFKNSYLFTLPSLWEGFGIDVLNAYFLGVPVVISNIASLPEVGGKAAIYVNPKSTKSIARGIEKVLNLDSKGYNKLIKKGYSHIKKFSWDKSAQKVLKILENKAK
jgi:glycosyltransferase involved in cell wall biosynthesis